MCLYMQKHEPRLLGEKLFHQRNALNSATANIHVCTKCIHVCMCDCAYRSSLGPWFWTLVSWQSMGKVHLLHLFQKASNHIFASTLSSTHQGLCTLHYEPGRIITSAPTLSTSRLVQFLNPWRIGAWILGFDLHSAGPSRTAVVSNM